MTIRQEFFAYLEHFGTTLTIGELAAQPALSDAIALRHDIDHDLDLALEIAHHEHVRGIRATYFLLHSHRYFDDPQFTAKVRQLADYGHEVGVHLNAVAMWAEGLTNDPDETLAAALARLRASDVRICGASAHGDKACYKHQCINYWMFSELAGPRPEERELGKSAEGIRVESPAYQIQYPPDGSLHRPDGASLPLWGSSMARHGLEYEVSHVPHDWYWTDTGGGWTRSADPRLYDLSRGRHQVLMHPFWWRGPQKVYFVLGTARCGSKWLANFVDRATNCRGLHEWTLNHLRNEKNFKADHRTGPDYQDLLEDPTEVAARLRAARAHVAVLKRDVLEANVYLEPVTQKLAETIPDAVLIHLHRHPQDVVRSLLNRGWYSTPDDRRYPRIPVDGWDDLSQVQRASWYVRHTNEQLARVTTDRLVFENMVNDLSYLSRRLTELGLVVHPLLAAEEFPKRINANESAGIGAYETWTPRMKMQFHEICADLCARLGFACDPPPQSVPAPSIIQHTIQSRSTRLAGGAVSHFSEHGLECKRQRRGLDVRLPAECRASHLLLTNGRWRNVERKDGVACEPGAHCLGELQCESASGGRMRVFVLFYDLRGELVLQRHVATIRFKTRSPAPETVPASTQDRGEIGRTETTSRVVFSAKAPTRATHLTVAVLCDPDETPSEFTIREATLSTRTLPAGYAVEDFA